MEGIRHLKREEIDKTKWNSCVHYANTGNVGGYMWYLDQLNKEWEALVEGDYESVLPLIWRQGRFGGKELYQPDLISDVGIFSINALTPKRVQAFLQAIPNDFGTISLALNEKTYPPDDLGFELAKQQKYYLLLNQPFEGLADAFSTDFSEKVQQAEALSLLPDSNLKPEALADFYQKHWPHRKGLDFNFHALQRIMWNAMHRGWGFPSAILNEKREPLAVDFFIYSHGKVQSVMPTVSPIGKKQGALEYLYYMLLRKHANQPLILDYNLHMENSMPVEMGARKKAISTIKRRKKKWFIFS